MKQAVQNLFKGVDIKINGERTWDIQVNNEKFYARVLAGGSLAFGESYMDGWWDCKNIDQLMYRILKARLYKKVRGVKGIVWHFLKAKILNQQNKTKAYVVGRKHYDIGNNLYKLMLDKRMNYSCGYWPDAKNLDEAQEAKLDLICKKLYLQPNETLLDIGCGWGGLAKFAAENYKVKVVGLTISKEQAKLAREICAGLDIEIRPEDYRQLDQKFDKIVSVGMFEHVGSKNYKIFFKTVDNCLKPDGLFLLHTIASNTSRIYSDPWINKYIFPNGMIPSAAQITKNYEGLLALRDWHNMGIHYDKTLMAWHKNFNDNWDKIKKDYDERFFRMWNYYLLACAGGFRSYYNHVWQIVFSKIDAQIDYKSLR